MLTRLTFKETVVFKLLTGFICHALIFSPVANLKEKLELKHDFLKRLGTVQEDLQKLAFQG